MALGGLDPLPCRMRRIPVQRHVRVDRSTGVTPLGGGGGGDIEPPKKSSLPVMASPVLALLKRLRGVIDGDSPTLEGGEG